MSLSEVIVNFILDRLSSRSFLNDLLALKAPQALLLQPVYLTLFKHLVSYSQQCQYKAVNTPFTKSICFFCYGLKATIENCQLTC